MISLNGSYIEGISCIVYIFVDLNKKRVEYINLTLVWIFKLYTQAQMYPYNVLFILTTCPTEDHFLSRP